MIMLKIYRSVKIDPEYLHSRGGESSENLLEPVNHGIGHPDCLKVLERLTDYDMWQRWACSVSKTIKELSVQQDARYYPNDYCCIGLTKFPGCSFSYTRFSGKLIVDMFKNRIFQVIICFFLEYHSVRRTGSKPEQRTSSELYGGHQQLTVALH